MGGLNTCNNKKLNKKIVISILLIILITFTLFIPYNIAQAHSVLSGNIVIEQESGRVLGGNNIYAPLPMASTTKILTALVVLQNMDIHSYITIPRCAVGVEGSSIYLKEGEKWRIIDLLYGLMLRSGNDSAVALAVACAGSLDGFNMMMNETVKNLGLRNSNYMNPHGLHDINHYTSAYDLAMITREAFNNETFREIISTKVYKFKSIDNINYVFHNKNKILNMYDGANGVKTGYTKAAGRCLVSSANRNGMQLITVALNHGNMWQDSMEMMNRAYNDYRMYELVNNNELLGETKVLNSRQKTTILVSKDRLIYPLRDDEISRIRYEMNCEPIQAPIMANKCVGDINIYLDNDLLFSVNVYTMEDIKEMSIKDKINEMIDKWRK